MTDLKYSNYRIKLIDHDYFNSIEIINIKMNIIVASYKKLKYKWNPVKGFVMLLIGYKKPRKKSIFVWSKFKKLCNDNFYFGPKFVDSFEESYDLFLDSEWRINE